MTRTRRSPLALATAALGLWLALPAAAQIQGQIEPDGRPISERPGAERELRPTGPLEAAPPRGIQAELPPDRRDAQPQRPSTSRAPLEPSSDVGRLPQIEREKVTPRSRALDPRIGEIAPGALERRRADVRIESIRQLGRGIAVTVVADVAAPECCNVVLEGNGERRDRIGTKRIRLALAGSRYLGIAMFDHPLIGENLLTASVAAPGDPNPANNTMHVPLGRSTTARGDGLQIRSLTERRRGRDWIELEVEAFNADNAYHSLSFDLAGIEGECRDGAGNMRFAFARRRAELPREVLRQRVVCTADDTRGEGRIRVFVNGNVVRQLAWNPSAPGGTIDRRAGRFARRQAEINETDGAPDLAVASVVASGYDGLPALLMVTIENRGTGTSPADIARVRVATVHVRDVPLPPIDAGGSWSSTIELRSGSFPCFIPTDTEVHATVTIDPTGAVYEANETNDHGFAALDDSDWNRRGPRQHFTLARDGHSECRKPGGW